MSARDRVLIAIMNNPLDFEIARNRHWYRIPTTSVDKWLKDRWPPQWLAFYQTKVFGQEAYAVNYYAQVIGVRQVYRWQLFPGQPRDRKSERRYYQLVLQPLQRLPEPIVSRRWRRIVFIPTTWHKFINATEINDLYDSSPLEDQLWQEFKRLQIRAERQELITVKTENYFLDFAIYCAMGKIDVETDGDVWHANPERAGQDNLRDNDVETAGWKVLRFNTHQIMEKMEEYCLPTIVENIGKLGGVEEGGILPRQIDRHALDGIYQQGLFDDL